MSKNIIFSLEKELERLKRYKENIQNRIEISKKIPQKSPEYLSKKIVGELKSQGREIIFGTNERIQAKEWSPSHLDDMTIINLEEVIQTQKEKLVKSEAEYLKTHPGKPFISKIDNYLVGNSKAMNASYLEDKNSILDSDITLKYQEAKAKSLIRGSDYMSYKENLKKATKSYNSPIQKSADLNFHNFLLNKEFKNEFESIQESYNDKETIDTKIKKSPTKKNKQKRNIPLRKSNISADNISHSLLPQKGQDIFLALLELFRNLDTKNTNLIILKDAISAIFKNKLIMKQFNLTGKEEDKFTEFISTYPFAVPGNVNWKELIEILYEYKNAVSASKKRQSHSPKMYDNAILKYKPKKENSVRMSRDSSLGYLHNNSFNEISITRPKSVSRVLNESVKDRDSRSKLDSRSKDSFFSSFQNKHVITITKPFKFDERDRLKPQRIIERRLEESVMEKIEEEENILHYKFKARPVPNEVKIPKYEMLMKKEEERRKEVRNHSREITMKREKPFSFYQSDIRKMEAKKKKIEDYIPDVMKNKPFKAQTKVPHRGKSLSEIQRKENAEREERIRKRKEELYLQAKYPPNMEKNKNMWEQKRKNQINEMKKEQFSNITFKPEIITKEVPNFKEIQENFTSKLEKLKKARKGTEIKEFQFKETKKNAANMSYLDNENKLNAVHLLKKDKDISYILAPPRTQPSTTKKHTALLEKVF